MVYPRASKGTAGQGKGWWASAPGCLCKAHPEVSPCKCCPQAVPSLNTEVAVLPVSAEPCGAGAEGRPLARGQVMMVWCAGPGSSGWAGGTLLSRARAKALGQAGSFLAARRGLAPEELHTHVCVHVHAQRHTRGHHRCCYR